MPSPLRSRRRIARAWAAAALSLGLVGGLLVGGEGSPAEAAPADPAAVAPVRLMVAPSEPVLAEADDEHSFTVQVENPGEQPIAGGTLRLVLAPERVDAEEELLDAFPVRSEQVAEIEVDQTAPDSTQTAAITVAADDLPLTGARPGVYRMQATLTPTRSDRRQTITPLSAETTIVWNGVEESRARLTAIVPIVLPTEVRAMPSRQQLDEAAPRFDALLTAATEARATLAIDPRIVAAIRAYGEHAPLQARRFLERLEDSQLPSFLLQFADADPAAQAALGHTELLQPTNLDYVTRQGSFPAREIDGMKVTEQPPSLEELLAWPAGDGPTAWPAEGQADLPTLELLRSSGITDYVLDSNNVTHSGGPAASLGDGQSALIADSELGAAVRTAVAAESETERQAGFATATAVLALAAQGPSTGRVLALDRGAVADSENAAAVLERLNAYDWVVATPAADQAEGTAAIRGGAPLDERREQLRTAAEREPEINAVGAVLVHPGDLVGYQRARLLDLFATHYAQADSGFEDAVRQFQQRDDELSLGVRAISTEHTQLVGTSTRVPVQLHNSLPFEAVVDVRVDPASAALSVTHRGFPRVAIAAEGNARVLVPVRSRVSSGESALIIEVTDDSGAEVAYTGRIPLTISSSIETIALWILGLAAALLLVFGTLRSLRRRSRRRSEASAEAADAENAEHDDALRDEVEPDGTEDAADATDAGSTETDSAASASDDGPIERPGRSASEPPSRGQE